MSDQKKKSKNKKTKSSEKKHQKHKLKQTQSLYEGNQFQPLSSRSLNPQERFQQTLDQRWKLCHPCQTQKREKCVSKCCPRSTTVAGSVIYRPGAPSSFPYVATWLEVQKIVNGVQGTVIVYFDSTFQSPIVLSPTTVGTTTPSLNGQNRVIFAPAIPKEAAQQDIATWAITATPSEIVTISIEEGIVLNDIASLVGPMKIIATPLGTAPFTFSTDSILLLENTFVLQNGATSGTAVIDIVAGDSLTILLDRNSVLDNSTVTTGPIVRVNATSTLALSSWENSLITRTAIYGILGATVNYGNDGSGQVWDQINYTGTVTQLLYETASFIGYDDTKVPPTLVPSPAPYGATVQQAIDALKGASVAGTWTPVFTSVTVGATVVNVTNQYSIIDSKFVHYGARFTFSNPSGAPLVSATFTYTLPVTNVSTTNGITVVKTTDLAGLSPAATADVLIGTNTAIFTLVLAMPNAEVVDVQISADYQI